MPVCAKGAYCTCRLRIEVRDKGPLLPLQTPPAIRVFFYLWHLNHQEVGLYGHGGKPKWFLELNPKGQVPVLILGEKYVRATGRKTSPGKQHAVAEVRPCGRIVQW